MKIYTLHGFMGGPQDFSFLSKIIRATEFIHLGLPGHFDSPVKASSWEEVTSHFAEKIEGEAAGEDFCLLGYSMGGRVMLGVAEKLILKNNSRFKGLILESAHIGIKDFQQKSERLMRDQDLFKNVHTPKDFDFFLRQWWSAPLFAGLNKHEDFERLIDHRKNSDPHVLQEAMNILSVGNQPDYEYLFSKKSFPSTLYLVGKLDQKYCEMGYELQRKYPKVLTVDFNCGHNIHFSEPRAFAMAIESWLQTLLKPWEIEE